MTGSENTEAENPEPDKEARTPAAPKKTSSARGSVLGAAMLGLGEVLEPEKASTDVVVEQSLDGDDDMGKKFDLDFGQLDDLDPQP